jgi:hypothetical protein
MTVGIGEKALRAPVLTMRESVNRMLRAGGGKNEAPETPKLDRVSCQPKTGLREPRVGDGLQEQSTRDSARPRATPRGLVCCPE